MNRSVDERIQAVMKLVEAARSIAASPGALLARIEADTGLSRQGVEYAFTHHLELNPSPDDVESLVQGAGSCHEVAVILSANVFTAPLRALAIACAAATKVTVRPSRRDPAFTEALVKAVEGMGITLADDLSLSHSKADELHIYGRSETIASIASKVPASTRVVGHGTGMGVAVVGVDDDLTEAAKRLAPDIGVFDQRGCLSPRIVFVHGGEARGKDFASALNRELISFNGDVPLGRLSADERHERRIYEDTMLIAGDLLVESSHTIGVAPHQAPLVLPPTGRCVHIAIVPTVAEMASHMNAIAGVVTTVGALEVDDARRVAPSHARATRLGWMQRPPLDGPVDRRIKAIT